MTGFFDNVTGIIILEKKAELRNLLREKSPEKTAIPEYVTRGKEEEFTIAFFEHILCMPVCIRSELALADHRGVVLVEKVT